MIQFQTAISQRQSEKLNRQNDALNTADKIRHAKSEKLRSWDYSWCKIKRKG